MYQVSKAILKDAPDKTQISLLFANVSADDILIEDLLSELQAESPRFKVNAASIAAKQSTDHLLQNALAPGSCAYISISSAACSISALKVDAFT